MRRGLLVVAMIAVLSGCANGGGPMNSPSETASGGRPPLLTSSAAPGGSPGAGAEVSVPPKRWAAIISDLTTRGVPTDSVTLVSARSVVWNDGSLGCPKPGQTYTQSLVPGMQVVVKVGAMEYDYHFGNSDDPRLCER
jgi:hypothetical protein